MHTDTSSSYRVQHLAALCGHCQTYVFIFPTVDFVHWATLYSMFCFQYTVLPSVYHVSFMFRFPGVQRWLLFSRLVTVMATVNNHSASNVSFHCLSCIFSFYYYFIAPFFPDYCCDLVGGRG